MDTQEKNISLWRLQEKDDAEFTTGEVCVIYE